MTVSNHTRMSLLGFGATCCLSLGVFLVPLEALAQAPAQQHPGQPPAAAQPQVGSQPTAPDINVSDDQIEAFAEANAKIRKHRENLQQKLQGVNDQQKAVALQQDYNSKVSSELASLGLDSRTYDQIGQAAQSDPELMQRIISKMN